MNKFTVVSLTAFTSFLLIGCQTIDVSKAFPFNLGGNAPQNESKINSEITVLEAQKILSKLGYKPGIADGIAGVKTIGAITSFQKDNGLESTGSLDAKTRIILKQRGDGAMPPEQLERTVISASADDEALPAKVVNTKPAPTYVRPNCPKYTQREMGVVDEMLHLGILGNNNESIEGAVSRGADVYKVACNTTLNRLDTDNLKLLAANGFTYRELCISFAFAYKNSLSAAQRLERIRYLLTQDVDVNCNQSRRFTALSYFYDVHNDRKLRGDMTADELTGLRLILDAGAKDDVNTYVDRDTSEQGERDRHTIYWASGINRARGVPILSVLLEYGLDPNGTSDRIVNRAGQFLFEKGPTLTAAAILEVKDKDLFQELVAAGGDMNKAYSLGGKYSGMEKNSNLMSSLKARGGIVREYELYVLDQGGKYFGE